MELKSNLLENKEVVPEADRDKPIFSASQLRIRPPRTAEDIRHDVREGRVSEMTPGQAGY
jgi:hypothetical protein